MCKINGVKLTEMREKAGIGFKHERMKELGNLL